MSRGRRTILLWSILIGITCAATELMAFAGWKLLLWRAGGANGAVETDRVGQVDPNVGLRLGPNRCERFPYGILDAAGSYRDDTPDWELCTNSLGWRTPEFSPSKPEGTFRMVCMGDSHTMGQGVAQDATFCSLLAARLARLVEARGDRLEVVNAGIWGHSSFQGLILYELFVNGWSPDLVIVGYGTNDAASLTRTGRPRRDRMEYALPGGLRSPSLLRYSARDLHAVRLAKAVAREVVERRLDRARDSTLFDGTTRYEDRRSTPLEYRENLEDLLDRIIDDGAQAVVVGIALIDPAYVTIQREVAISRGLPYLATWSRFDELEASVRSGAMYPEDRDRIDGWLTDAGREPTGRWSRYLTTDGGHPSEIGHEIIAADLFDLLGTRLRDPSTPAAAN